MNREIVELSDAELEQVSGGGAYDNWSLPTITSLEGVTTSDVTYGFILDGKQYIASTYYTHDIKGKLCMIYGCEGTMILIPCS